jgi:hypothetical protein
MFNKFKGCCLVNVKPRGAAAMNATESATMATSSGKNPDNTGTPSDTLMDDDDETIITETPSTTNNFLEAEMIDLNLWYEIPYQKGQSSTDDFKNHVHFLLLLTKAFDKSTLRIYNNKNQRVKSFL